MPPAHNPVPPQPLSFTNTPYTSGMFMTQLDPVTGYTSLIPVSTAPTTSTSGAALQGSPLQQSPFNRTFRGRGYGNLARGGAGKGRG